MSRKFTLALALCATIATYAQPTDLYKTPEWSDKPVLHSVPAGLKDASACYLLDSRTYHYKTEGKEIVQYNTIYRLVKVTDDKGIEMFNKIYIPFNKNIELTDIRARVITSLGKVIDIPADKIKEEDDEGKRYKLFAMEGMDKGSEIEYSYTFKRNPTYFGSEIFQTKAVPFYQARILVICPRHLKFSGKGYNGFKMFPDSVINEEHYLAGYSENIPELEDEKYGLAEPHRQRADFKLSYNLSRNPNVEVYTWKEVVRNAYANYTTYTDKEKKAINKFIESANIPDNLNEEKTIVLLEDYLKTTINADEKIVSDDASDIEKIVKTGNSNNYGITRLFVALLENKNIRYQIVFPSVRDQLPLDEELANWNRVDETIIYFPGTGKFLQPSGAIYRYPYVEPYWSGTRGLFLKGTMIGDVRTAVAKFDTIPMVPFEENAHNMEVFAKMDPSSDSMIVDTKQILKGHAAISYRPIWAYLPKDKQDETIKQIINNVAKSENIQNIKTENTKFTDATDGKPLIISATLHTADLLDRAGNKLLFKVGELIGTQEQMYQEKTRRLPADLPYAHVLLRKIKFEIPDGYQIKNLNDLNIDVQYKPSDLVTMGFVSSYTLNGNILDIDINEVYHEIFYPISQFDMYRKVINASADFNKVVLVLEKKK